jgi:hypothetical protein
MHFVTVASDPHFGLDRLKSSAVYHGLDLQVLGYGRPFLGKGSKFLYLAEFAATLPAQDLVVFTDAYDSVFLAGAERFEEVISQMSGDLIVSAEQNLFMRGHPLFFPWQTFPTYLRYPAGPKPYRFLNSGTLVASAGRLAGLCDEAGITPDIDSDQTVLSRYFCRHPDRLRLDYRHHLMTCNGGRVGMEESDYSWVEGRLRNNLTGSFPCVLHVPGKNEESLCKLLKEAPLSLRREPTGTERDIYRKRAFLQRAVCKVGLDNYLARFLFWNMVLLLGLALIFCQ